jgi:hypothetical protein
MPAGVTVTFTPSVLRFTGNQATAHTATMTVHCTGLVPLDCYPFTVTGTSRRGSITTTNWVTYTPDYVRTRIPTLELDNLGNNELRLRGLGATGQSYNIEATSDLGHPVWESLGTTTADGNGRFVFFTTQTATAPLRFYRAVLPAP